MEKEYAESALADQIQYDLGRMYQKKGDVFKSREHFNRVVFTYPQSLFARKAKERLFMLGLIEKKGK
jgi:TolA-binding protein